MCNSVACSAVTAQAAQTKQALTTDLLRSNAKAEQSVVDLISQALQASTPPGVGAKLDITA